MPAMTAGIAGLQGSGSVPGSAAGSAAGCAGPHGPAGSCVGGTACTGGPLACPSCQPSAAGGVAAAFGFSTQSGGALTLAWRTKITA